MLGKQSYTNGVLVQLKIPKRLLKHCYFINCVLVDRFNSPECVFIPGPKGEALRCEDVGEFWSILFDTQILQIITENTNAMIAQKCREILGEGRDLQTYHNRTDTDEIKAFLGLLYYGGLWKSSHVNTHELWSKENGISFYRCVMP